MSTTIIELDPATIEVECASLADIMTSSVQGGAAISFMQPLIAANVSNELNAALRPLV